MANHSPCLAQPVKKTTWILTGYCTPQASEWKRFVQREGGCVCVGEKESEKEREKEREREREKRIEREKERERVRE